MPAVLFTVCFFMASLFTACRKAADSTSALLPDTAGLRDGDLIFRKGRSNLSRIIMTIYPGEFSHTGLLRKTKDGWHVIHASENDEDGKREEVIEVPLSQFVDKAKGIGVARVKCSAQQATLAMQTALDMARLHVPFDSEYNLQDASKVYCTELVYVAYKTAGVNLLQAPSKSKPALVKSYLFPEELWKNPRVISLQLKGMEK